MRYINLRLTYLLTYLLTYNRKLRRERPTLSEGITNETISALLAVPLDDILVSTDRDLVGTRHDDCYTACDL